VVTSGARAPSIERVAPALFCRQVRLFEILNLMDCAIGTFDHWAYTIFFGPLSNPQPPKHEAQRGEVMIVVGRGEIFVPYLHNNFYK
jgi:hypothetical protein